MIVALVVMATEGGGGGTSADNTVAGSNLSPSPSVLVTTDAVERQAVVADSHLTTASIMGESRLPFLFAPPVPDVTPPPRSPEPAQEAASGPYRLTEHDFYLLAITVGFEREHVIEEAYRVACGGGSTIWGESYCTPSARNGIHVGLFQISTVTAEATCGVGDPYWLSFPANNLWCARQIILWSEEHLGERWALWQVQP